MYKLREVEKEDIEIINKWRSNKKMIENLGAPFRYINMQIDLKWYENYLLNREATIRCSILCDKKLIGLVSLTNIDKINRSAILHIMIGEEENRGKGAGYFAIKEIINHGFFDMNLQRIELEVLERNKKAIRLYEKIGFQIEGIKREAIYKDGKYVDLIIMGMLKKIIAGNKV